MSILKVLSSVPILKLLTVFIIVIETDETLATEAGMLAKQSIALNNIYITLFSNNEPIY